jgi:FkbM family methyltransferase
MGGHLFDLHGVTANDGYWLAMQDDPDSEFIRMCRRLILPDFVCLDIGANIGVKSLYLSKHCSEGRVVAVEAGTTVAECLQTNIAANSITNVVAMHAAVGSEVGTMHFYEDSAWGHVGEGIAVEAVTLDEVVRRNGLSRVDFVKIDVEGAELPILKSSMQLINRFESLVFVELNSLTLLVWGNTNPREFVEWVTANFKYVYALNRSPDGDMFTEVTSSHGCNDILHRNLVKDGLVTDLVMSNSERRFKSSVAALEQQIEIIQAARVSAQVALRDAEALLRQAQAERDALLASTSWRLSAPARWMMRGLQRGA